MAGSVPEDAVYGAVNHSRLDFGLVPGRRRQEGGVTRGPGLLHCQSRAGLPRQWERRDPEVCCLPKQACFLAEQISEALSV